MRIAVDVMGGDKGPREIILGCIEAANHLSELPGVDQIVMVGKEDVIRKELAALHVPESEQLAIEHAAEAIEMTDKPVDAVRHKKDNSMVHGMGLIKSGAAQAFVSPGNSGAFVAAALLTIGRIKGVHRPAIAAVLPTEQLRPFVLLDAGANMDCEPEWLAQFAIMGSTYAEKLLGAGEHPRVGLVSIGTEDTKGNALTLETFQLLKKAPYVHFRGNIEGHDLFRGETDVAVCDGFVGNVILKTTEATARVIGHWVKDVIRKNPVRMIGALLMKGGFGDLKRRIDPDVYGGALLLGVPGVCIVTHGASSPKAIYHAIRVAAEGTKKELAPTIAKRIADYRAQLSATEKTATEKTAEPSA